MECVGCKKYMACEVAKNQGELAYQKGILKFDNPYLLVPSEVIDPLVYGNSSEERKLIVNTLVACWLEGWQEENNKNWYIQEELMLLQERRLLLICLCSVKIQLERSKLYKWFSKVRLLLDINKSIKEINATFSKYKDPSKITKKDWNIIEKLEKTSEKELYFDEE